MNRESGIRPPTLASIAASCLLLVPVTSAAVTVTATQSPATVRPGQTTVTLLRLDLTNSSLVAATLYQLKVKNLTTWTCTHSQLDAELGSLHLYQDSVTR